MKHSGSYFCLHHPQNITYDSNLVVEIYYTVFDKHRVMTAYTERCVGKSLNVYCLHVFKKAKLLDKSIEVVSSMSRDNHTKRNNMVHCNSLMCKNAR
jgi:hypothetical protein